MNRLEMMEKIMHALGLENERVIGFCRLCESLEYNEINEHYLEVLFEVLLTPIDAE